jgi:nicotinate (nicotinamide) nucleotide adenylyltransferase
MWYRETILKAVKFHRRSMRRPQLLGVLAGSFNPPTIAHLELVQAAVSQVDELLCVVPSVLPHKEFFGATLEQRLEMLAALDDRAGVGCSIASSEKGLFTDIARECREHYGADTRLYFVCGRDAAERILGWDYGRPGVVEEMLQEFELLVAARSGEFRPPVEFRHRVHALNLRAAYDEVSSTEVRDRIARGDLWEHLVPAAIVERVREIYS